jgi:C-terminal processing protease CtpA/Prc
MVLEPIAASGETGGTRTECGCHVKEFSKSGTSQAFDKGVIGIGDVIVEIEGTDVSAEDYPYASIIALLKQTSGTKSITFRRKSASQVEYRYM